MIKELAGHQKSDQHMVTTTEEDLHRCLFGNHPQVEALIAEESTQPIGHALFFTINSSYTGKLALFLEELYVKPQHRRKAVGKALFMHVVGLAHTRGYVRIDWKLFEGNQAAINFYRSFGAVALKNQMQYRLPGKMIETLVTNSELSSPKIA